MDDDEKRDTETKSDARKATRNLGIDRGKVCIEEDFDAPNAEITELFEDP